MFSTTGGPPVLWRGVGAFVAHTETEASTCSTFCRCPSCRRPLKELKKHMGNAGFRSSTVFLELGSYKVNPKKELQWRLYVGSLARGNDPEVANPKAFLNS